MGFAQFTLASSTVKVRADPSKWKFDIVGMVSLHVYPSSSAEDMFSVGADIHCLRLSDDKTETILNTGLSSGLINCSFGWKVDLAAYVTALTGESVDEFLSRNEESSPKRCKIQYAYEVHVKIVDSILCNRNSLFPIHSGTLICRDSNSQTRRHLISKEFFALNSDFFLTLFYGDFSEKNQKEIELKDVNFVAFGSVMHCLGKRRLISSTSFTCYEDLISLLPAMKCSLRFMFTEIYKQIREFMLQFVSIVTFPTMDKRNSIRAIRSFDSANDEELFKKFVDNLHLDGVNWAVVVRGCYGTVSQKGMDLLLEKTNRQIRSLEKDVHGLKKENSRLEKELRTSKRIIFNPRC